MSLFCLSKGDQMALGAGPGPGEPGLWAGRGDSLSVSGDGIRRDKAGLSRGRVSGAPRMCAAARRLASALC